MKVKSISKIRGRDLVKASKSVDAKVKKIVGLKKKKY